MKKSKFGTKVLVVTFSLLCVVVGSCDENNPVVEILKVNENSNALPHTKQFGGEVATEWFNLLSDITRAKPYFSPQVLRIYSYSGIALYESVVPGMPSYQSIYKHLTGNTIEFDNKKDYYWPACANAAIARIASRIMSNYSAPDLTQVEALEASFNSTFQTMIKPEQLEFSIEFGRKVGDIIYEWSKTDGTFNPDMTPKPCPPYVLVDGPYKWEPTPPAFLPAAGACQGSLRTFIPNIVNHVLAPDPLRTVFDDPVSGDPPVIIDLKSLFDLAAKETYEARNNTSDEETRQFNNWRDFPPNYSPLAHMMKISTNIMIEEKVNLEDAATLYAKLTMAASDAIGAVFYSKYFYSILRPVTYIRNEIDNTWSSLPNTPQTPSYPEELAPTASSVAILEEYFGENYEFVDDIHSSTHGEWSYTSFDQLLDNILQARVSGGTNFRFSGDEGVKQGRLVGTMVDQLPFKK